MGLVPGQRGGEESGEVVPNLAWSNGKGVRCLISIRGTQLFPNLPLLARRLYPCADNNQDSHHNLLSYLSPPVVLLSTFYPFRSCPWPPVCYVHFICRISSSLVSASSICAVSVRVCRLYTLVCGYTKPFYLRFEHVVFCSISILLPTIPSSTPATTTPNHLCMITSVALMSTTVVSVPNTNASSGHFKPDNQCVQSIKGCQYGSRRWGWDMSRRGSTRHP